MTKLLLSYIIHKSNTIWIDKINFRLHYQIMRVNILIIKFFNKLHILYPDDEHFFYFSYIIHNKSMLWINQTKFNLHYQITRSEYSNSIILTNFVLHTLMMHTFLPFLYIIQSINKLWSGLIKTSFKLHHQTTYTIIIHFLTNLFIHDLMMSTIHDPMMISLLILEIHSKFKLLCLPFFFMDIVEREYITIKTKSYMISLYGFIYFSNLISYYITLNDV